MRLLLVEDDPALGEGIRVALKPEGYTVDWLQDGRSALHALTHETFDLAVLDLGLPDMDGLEVLRRLRERQQSVPVLVLTARDATSDRIQGLDAGADDYMVKPFEVGELTARLRALLRRSFGRPQPVLEHGGVRLDPVSQEVSCRGEVVTLQRKEFLLLHQLMSQPGRVFTRDRLEEVLYGWSETAAESNALEVHIHHLRRKLYPELIRTVRGVGYRIDPA
ncbi:response regulator transcription factor [Brachymonas sp. G13]|uniref:response regulator transcription factor n=1 Tax=Brachymonas TaxID=28219 RepID=UPI0016B36D01|nr:response regulator transcription factor [Brachymonas sp. J145]MEE1653167.1 response regulator transcription factor [Brachymonas sp. J145]NLX15702.1 response regulator transcription factor [Ramlibacter sp.]